MFYGEGETRTLSEEEINKTNVNEGIDESERVLYKDQETTQKVLEALNASGFDCGTPDGISGNKTKSAIKAFRESNGLQVTDEINDVLLAALGFLKRQ